ncbi:F-box/kelch-repeat protein At1g57790-like [Papaver somniferum]|uniref:F-box/kelch-repeat protein At1g57790-like n=1 Tax=Papaver somniferum TaxID=3469 RepID=UPI000E6FB830|nr:F-box/kelch-repeat protein At1g57790-like [Papaver somniferum]
MTDLLLSQDTTETSIEEENMVWVTNSIGESEALKQWDFLNDHDSTEEIARHLHPVDYIHFRIASKRNSIFLRSLSRILASTRTTATTYLSPWLISIFEDNEKIICNIVDPMHNNDKYLLKLSDQLVAGATIRFSKDGWLLLSNGKKTVFCYNPFTRGMIFLPDVPDNYALGGMSFSSVPTSRDCVVIAISNWWELTGNNEISFLVTKLGKSATGWTIYRFNYEEYSLEYNFMPCVNNPVFYNGAFYCLDYNGMLGVFNMKGDFSWKVLSKSLKQFGGFYPSYLVECDDKLLLVNLGHCGKSVDIYRLDDSEMVWVKLNSLGKHALFISNTSSFSAVAPRSCMENNIYFPRLYGGRILYYSLDTRRYHCVGSDQHTSQDFHNTKERSNSTWIEPYWSQASISQNSGDI